MSKNNLTKEDVKDLINCLRSYDNLISEQIKKFDLQGNVNRVDDWIDEHNVVVCLIDILKK